MANINELSGKIWNELKNNQNIEIEASLKNSKIGNIFAAAVLTAADKSQRDIAKWAGSDGKLSLYEMARAIEEINEKNIKLRGNYKDKTVKVRDKDRYTGRNERAKNTDAEKSAFELLNQIDDSLDIYDWTGKNGENQLEERTKEINSGRRDAEKAVRVMIRELNQDKISELVDDATAQKQTNQAKITTNTQVDKKDEQPNEKQPEATDDGTPVKPTDDDSTPAQPAENGGEQTQPDNPTNDDSTPEQPAENDGEQTQPDNPTNDDSTPEQPAQINRSEYKGKELSDLMIEYVDNNVAAISDEKFQKYLNEIELFSASELVSFIKNFKDENIMEMITDEVNSAKVEQDACRKVANALITKAKELGIDTTNYEKQYKYEIEQIMSAERLDQVTNAIIAEIEIRQNFNSEDVNKIQTTSTEESTNETNQIIEKRLNEAKQSFENQLKNDGWAGDVADFLSKAYNSSNTADKIRTDLSEAEKQLERLQEAAKKGEKEFKEEFKKTFGIEYNYPAIVAFQKAAKEHSAASAEATFNEMFKKLLSKAPLTEETRRRRVGGQLMEREVVDVIKTKEQVYNEEYKNLSNFFGAQGTELIDSKIKEMGLENAPIEQKYEALKQLAKEVSEELHSQKTKVCGDKTLEDIRLTYQNLYKSAYGYSNDIMKRVTDYNNSQQTGAAIVKAGAVVAATMAGATTGGLATAAIVAASTTIATEVTDRATTGKALDALKNGTIEDYLKTVNDDIEWTELMKNAAISGGAVMIGGVVANGVKYVAQGASHKTQALAMFFGDAAVDTVYTKFTSGELRIGDLVFTVLLSGAGNIAAIKRGAISSNNTTTPTNSKTYGELQNKAALEQRAKANPSLLTRGKNWVNNTINNWTGINSLVEPHTPLVMKDAAAKTGVLKQMIDDTTGVSAILKSVDGLGPQNGSINTNGAKSQAQQAQAKSTVPKEVEQPEANTPATPQNNPTATIANAENNQLTAYINKFPDGRGYIPLNQSRDIQISVTNKDNSITLQVIKPNGPKDIALSEAITINATDIKNLSKANAAKHGGLYIDESGNIRLTDAKLQEINASATQAAKTNTSTNAKGVDSLPSGRHTTRLETLITKDTGFVTPNAKGLPKNTVLIVSKEKDFITFRVYDKKTMQPIGEKVEIKINDIGTLTKENASKNGGIYVDTDGNLALESNAIKTIEPTATKATKGNTPKTVEAITSQHEPQGAFRQERLQQNQSIEVSGNAHIKLSNKYVLNLESLNLKDGQKVTIGRDSKADIRISNADDTVSRIHLTVERNGNNYTVTNYSANTTRVYGDEIKAAKNPNISHSKQPALQVSHYSRLTQLTDKQGFRTPNAKGIPENCSLEVLQNNNTITFRVLDKSGKQVGKTVEINAKDINTLTEANAQKNGGIYLDKDGKLVITESNAIKTIEPTAPNATKGNTPKTVEAFISYKEPPGHQIIQQNQAFEASGKVHVKLSGKYVLNLERLNIQDGQKVTIGRGTNADIRISNADDTVSRIHLTVERKGNNYIVTNHSINVTRVYGDEIKTPSITHSTKEPITEAQIIEYANKLKNGESIRLSEAHGIPNGLSITITKDANGKITYFKPESWDANPKNGTVIYEEVNI